MNEGYQVGPPCMPNAHPMATGAAMSPLSPASLPGTTRIPAGYS
jgi:hypothetical protein